MIQSIFTQTILFGIAGLLFAACSSPYGKSAVRQIVLDIDKTEPLILGDIFDEVACVPLSDSFLIGEIDCATGNRNPLSDLYHSSGLSEEANPILVVCKFK